jgi:hypothetical protein
MFSALIARVRPFTAGKQCALFCAIGLAAAVVPQRWFDPARAAVDRVLLPGQETLAPGLDAARRLVQRMSHLWQAAADVGQLEDRVAELESTNRSLRLQMTASVPAAPDISPAVPVVAVEPLVRTSLIQARVLGWQARRYLARRDLLDVGARLGALPDALVLADIPNEPVLLDAGRDLGLASHERVLAHAGGTPIVWGKLVDVGPMTSTLRRANDAGYRDLAQLAHVSPDGLRFGARGVLEGQGERLCRLTRITQDVPVDVGDLVFSAENLSLHDAQASGGAAAGRFLYGTVVRIERSAASAHWNIWVEPAIDGDREPKTVAVASTSLDPIRASRLAARSDSPPASQVK